MKFLKVFGRDTFWYFIGIGLVAEILIFVMTAVFMKIYGISKIENDIANRTRLLQKEAENEINKKLYEAEKHKRETGKALFNAFSGVNESNNSGILYQLNETTQPKLNICIKCGKEIDSRHMYCRYCGAKQG